MGYVATALAKKMIEAGDEVFGTCRHSEKINSLTQQGIKAFLFPDQKSEKILLEAISRCRYFIFSIPPDAEGDPALAVLGKKLTFALKGKSVWVGYLSSTAVYGHRDGGWVDEESPPQPTTGRGKARLAAERFFQNWCAEIKASLAVFRLAGIYGPKRNALENLKKGKTLLVEKPGQIFNRIHRDDAVAVLYASIHHAQSRMRVYNVCDDFPAPPQTVLLYAASLLGMTPPPVVPFEKAELSAMAKSFYSENKRVSNRRIKEELGVYLKWTNYKTGLRSILDGA